MLTRVFLFLLWIAFIQLVNFLSASNNNQQARTTTSQAQRQLPALPQYSDATRREPPPPYSLSHRNIQRQIEPPRNTRQRRPAPPPPAREQPTLRSRSHVQQITRSRFEQFRNSVFVSDSDSEEDRARRQRISPPQRNPIGFKNEVLLGKSAW